MADGTTYYAILSGTDKIQLAASAGDAATGTAIDFTGTGAGSAQNLSSGKLGRINSKVDTDADTIAVGIGHGLSNGDAVVYRKDAGGTVIGGLADGTTYYAMVIGADKVKLAASIDDVRHWRR